MNKNLRQIFTVVVIMFVILGCSTTVLTAFRANELNADPRNRRALYYQFGAPRGSILSSDGTVLAKSDPSNDAFSYQRSYSNGQEYAPVTGFFSISQNADRGIEASRAALLSGTASALAVQKFKALLTGTENKGASIETSINTKLQDVAYQALSNQGYDGAVVAIVPKTGRIVAMVSTPSYDPNVLAQHDTVKVNNAYAALTSDATNPMLNRATSELYPPGSTFKTVVAAAALESGKYQADTQIPAGSAYTLPNTATQLTNATTAANGTNGQISLSDAMAYSSNTAFAQLGVALGEDAIAEQAKKLGFGQSITVDGSTSTGNPMKAVASTFPSNLPADKLALAAIGQGDTLETPLQNAMIAAAIANGGTLMQPTLVDRVRASDLSTISETKPVVMSQAMSSNTASALTGMMENVVSKESPTLAINGVQVAAKTGTAQIGTDNQSIDAWVMGFAPADNPKIAVAVVIHNVNAFGVTAAGPVMKQVMEEALKQ